MSGFVREVPRRKETIQSISDSFDFPWNYNKEMFSVSSINGEILAETINALEDHPSFTRSLRDGYAVKSSDIKGANESSPAYLKYSGAVPMGYAPEEELTKGQAFQIFTGGMIPEGADCVVMVEDTSITGKWIEVRKAMQAGAHVIERGEEIRTGQTILSAGHVLDFRSTGIMAHMGISKVPVTRPCLGVISTGDEIAPVGEKNIPLGVTRDVNMEFLHSFFKKYGFCIKRYGISGDVKSELYNKTEQAVAENDIILVSGGSSVSVRDFTSEVFEVLLNSKLYLRGLRIKPGKPTLFAASKEKRKLLFGLPGHPLSCAVVASTFVLPVILNSIAPGSYKDDIQEFNLAEDVNGTTGIEEFIPFRFSKGKIFPVMSKSGYVGSLIDTDGLIVLGEQTETLRKEELAGVVLWK